MVDAILEARTLPVAMHNPSLFTTPILLMQNYPNGLRQGCQTIIQRGPHNITTRTYKLENMQSTQINVSPLIYIEPTITKTKMNQQYRWGSISVDIKSGSTQAPWIHSKPVLIQPVPYRGKQGFKKPTEATRILQQPQWVSEWLFHLFKGNFQFLERNRKGIYCPCFFAHSEVWGRNTQLLLCILKEQISLSTIFGIHRWGKDDLKDSLR